MRLLLIRHGQTPANVLGLLDTARPGPGLTDLGLEQAGRIPQALAEHPLDALYASTLVRTQHTARPLSQARGLGIEVREGLHEIDAGDLEGRRDRDAVRTYMETVMAWGVGERDIAMPGGADGHEFFGRYDENLRTIAGSGVSAAAIVSHGAAIRVWVAATATNISPTFAAENHLDNTGIVVLDGSFETGWTLTEWAGQPIGGAELADATAQDPSGDPLSELQEPGPHER
jgi:broad specificity phosphatase PhoE